MSALKRSCDPSSSAGAPPEKRRDKEGGDGGEGLSTAVETVIKLGGVSNSVIEDELRERVERLETRQATDDASLLILNRYWNQFDENMRLLARRYDQSGSQPVDTQPGEGRSLKPGTPEPDGDSNQERAKDRGPQGEGVSSFLAMLASSSSEEMEAELKERVESSCKQASCVVEICENLKSTVDQLKKDLDCNSDGVLLEIAARLNTLLANENERLRQLTDDLKQKHSHMTSESRSLARAATRADNRIGELQVSLNSKGYKVCGEASSVCGTITINKRKFEEMNSELEENQELAENRLSELQKLQQDLQTVVQENNNMKVELTCRAQGLVKETAEYRCLQSQFSVLYNESLVLKAQLDETRARLNTTRAARLRQLDHMENDEVSLQRKVRTEVIQLEDTLAQVRKEYEMLRIEFEQTLAANEQAGPINREMRHLISTLQTHNQQMKGEVVKFKLRLREAQQDLNQLRATKANPAVQSQSSTELEIKEEPASALTSTTTDVSVKAESDNDSATPTATGVAVKTEPGTEADATVKEEEKDKDKEKEEKKEKEKDQKERERVMRMAVKEEKEKAGTSSSQSDDGPAERCAVIGGPKRKEVEQLKIVRVELKKAQESQREMKLLLDMYRSAPKEQRDKVQLMAAEKKLKAEAEELRQRLRDLEERERREGKKMADEEALRKIRIVEEQIDEEDALLSEMDVTGQAFEDMQEQNIRLMQQLREKDDANFKLMSERIKSNQIHKLLKEEKEELADQLLTLKTQVDAQLQVVRKLEEKERLLQGTISAAERELGLRTQALDMNKRKAQESALLSEEVRAQLEEVQQRLKEVREEEDISKLRRKIENVKKPAESIRNGDEILNAEINEYKARLTCPCCNSRVKDAVLTKCFHVFCFECVKTRYDTRQRKCPKCNAAFGANDFHRIYIG
ncbi:E3 ubiquitin-protein ligase BRE1A [Bagarius yarrelli]|uniref:E3 ubiquitin protein ligase n=1 Tax=Bagarius yarrelli TaxID=175774 RepID=A0A556V5M1_BAGYA|nr:E3 ubiquitin-protein ligase BRE1A [Bagarius yarrelli]